MKVAMAAIGSRGDVVPFSNLAGRLVERGHEVTVVTHSSLSSLVAPASSVVDVPSDPDQLLAGPATRALRSGSVRALNRTRHVFADFLDAAGPPAREALRGADVLVASTFAVAPVHEALKAGVDVVRAHLWPEFTTTSGPMPLLPYGWLAPSPLRRLARGALRRVETYLGGVSGTWRRGRLHLAARHPVGLTTATLGSLYAYSPELVAEAPPDGTVTGWWTGRDASASLSADVAAALLDGKDWIYAGFGSMPQTTPGELVELLGAACERAGVHAVAQIRGVSGGVHPRLLCVGPEPHDELFRHVRAAIHHGGAGTTSSAVRAGIPSVVVPHFADQYYWGQRLHAVGVAARPLPRRLAGPTLLARGIRQALEPGRQRVAATLAHRVAIEDGAGRAAEQIERWLAVR